MRSFASDNQSGTHPKILEALTQANTGHAKAYGDDPWTERGAKAVQRALGTQGEVVFVFNGTGANVTAMACMTQPFEAVICSSMAHLHVDECGAPERIANCKLLPVPREDGKLRVADIEAHLWMIGDYHHPQPKVVSITQVNEVGQVYGLDELRELSACCREHDLYLHMDGARVANAAVALGCGLEQMVTDCGIDVLSFGGTKNGLMFGEAVVFLRQELSERAHFYRKQSAQLASKMRYIGAQFEALMHADLWHSNAMQANAMAKLLSERLVSVGVELSHPTEANGVFARLTAQEHRLLLESHFHYLWNEASGEVRLMASFDTTETDVEELVRAIQAARKEP